MTLADELEWYLTELTQVLGHADRHAGLRDYCRGLLLPIARKSIDPIAAHLDPERVPAKHQALHHFVAKSPWSDEAVLRNVREIVFPHLALDEACYWIVDETGIPKQGRHSVGVARQYCGRDQLTAWGLRYAVAVRESTTVLPPGVEPLPPEPYTGRGRPAKKLRRRPGHEPVSVKALAQSLPQNAYQTVTWKEGSNAPLRSRFAAVRVRAAHRDYWRATLREPEWLLIEWPETESAPSHYFLCTLPETYSLTQLVYTAKMRWRIERDYRELKQEVGLGHYEGRNWRGFHHHATLTIAAYGFLLLQRLKVWNKIFPQAPSLPPGYVPRGRPKSATPRTRHDRNDPSWDCATDRPRAPAMYLLRESA